MLHEFRARGRMLDHGAARGEIAMQHGEPALRLDRIFARPDRVLPRYVLGLGDDLAQRLAGDRFGVEIDQAAELRHQLWHAAGMMEVLHIVLAGGFEVDQHRHLAAYPVESFEIDAMRCAVGNRGQMNEAIGRAANRLQHHLRIFERGLGQEFARPRAFRFRHRCGDPAARLRRAEPLGVRRGNSRAHRQRQSERLGDAGHGACRTHHHAGADGRRQASIHRLDLIVVDFAGAILRP